MSRDSNRPSDRWKARAFFLLLFMFGSIAGCGRGSAPNEAVAPLSEPTSKESAKTNPPALPSNPAPPQKMPPDKTLYLVPIGSAPMSEINDLVPHYREKFSLPAVVLPPLAVSPQDVDSNRQQLIAENLIDTMLGAYSSYLTDHRSVMIGITGEDMYTRGEHWQFCFGTRLPESRAAVVSTARMSLEYPGMPAAEASMEKRLRKIVTKDIGILYFHMSANDRPTSVLYSGILGIEELDQVTEDF